MAIFQIMAYGHKWTLTIGVIKLPRVKVRNYKISEKLALLSLMLESKIAVFQAMEQIEEWHYFSY